MAASGAYDVLVLVHDFPYRSLPSEVATANEVTGALLAATADRPAILPVYVSLTSGEPPPETKALLDETGDGAPLLRGAIGGVPGDRRGRRLGGAPRARRVEGGRGGRAGRRSPRTGRRTARTRPAIPRPARASIALSERESLAFLARRRDRR